ncbi:hypothetical protein [Candidatus Chlamydia corallus]|uniref:hypothetical protein n=1 Tax=Candidatus Chlamydia corallus TaxID=2038470 RepID=UPI00126000A8|nr:hypothetical protein [Candidatus Chlamydia corallus]
MSTSPLGVPTVLNTIPPTTKAFPLLSPCLKEWLLNILLLTLGGICTIVGCIVMVLTKQILYGLVCVVGGVLLAMGILLKPGNFIYRNADNAARSLSSALE